MACLLALDEDEREKLVTDFKQVYLSRGPADLQGQVPFLARLGEHYESLGIKSGNDWTHLLKVCVFVVCLLFAVLFTPCLLREFDY